VADGDALTESGEAERGKRPPRLLRQEQIGGIGAGGYRDQRRQPVRRAGRRDRMSGVADGDDMRVGNRSQIGVDPNPAPWVGGEAGATCNGCRAQSARPHADVKGNASSFGSHDLCRAHLGDRLSIDHGDAEPREFRADGGFDPFASEVTAA
jgi:hypothetical protein